MRQSTVQMDSMFNPKSIALIGASSTPGKIGSTILFCLTAGGFKGKIYPINPKETEIQGLKVYDKIANLPERVDLAVICVVATLVPQVIEECAEAGVKFGVVISAGFGESGQEGEEMQKKIVKLAREKGMRFVGPNCMGIGSATSSLYATMNFTIPTKGNVSIVSQSGTLATIIALGGSSDNVGFSKYISSGNEADLHNNDFLEYYAHDPDTKIVTAFIEGIKNGQEFIKAAREVTKNKPLVVLKGGSTEAGAKAVASHTGSLAGADEVFESVCTQTGIIRTNSSKEVTDLIKAFSLLPLPKGRKVVIVSAQGGFGVLMADACIKNGLELADLTKETIDELNKFLPYFWSHSNPVDVTGGVSDFREITKALNILLRQEDIQSAICLAPTFSALFAPVASRVTETAQEILNSMVFGMMGSMEDDFINDLIELRAKYNKPIIGASLLPADGSESMKKLENGDVPIYDTPDQIAYVLAKLADYREYRERIGSNI